MGTPLNENRSQSQDPPPADLLRFGDETGHDPTREEQVGASRLSDWQAENRLDRNIAKMDRYGP